MIIGTVLRWVGAAAVIMQMVAHILSIIDQIEDNADFWDTERETVRLFAFCFLALFGLFLLAGLFSLKFMIVNLSALLHFSVVGLCMVGLAVISRAVAYGVSYADDTLEKIAEAAFYMLGGVGLVYVPLGFCFGSSLKA